MNCQSNETRAQFLLETHCARAKMLRYTGIFFACWSPLLISVESFRRRYSSASTARSIVVSTKTVSI